MKRAAGLSGPTAPLVDASVDLKGFPGFILDVEALLASELIALATPEEITAALMLWCRAWQQVPHGSLPNDERVLAAFSRSKNWEAVRDMALRGFVLCSDGRLYHRMLCKKVQEAWAHRQAYSKRRGKDADRLRGWRERKEQRPGSAGEVDAWAGEADTGEGEDETRVVAAVKRVSKHVSTPVSNPVSTRVSKPLRREVKGREENDSVPGGTGAVGAVPHLSGMSGRYPTTGKPAVTGASFDAFAGASIWHGQGGALCSPSPEDGAGVGFQAEVGYEAGGAGRAIGTGIANDSGDSAAVLGVAQAGSASGNGDASRNGGITLVPAALPRRQLWQAGKALLAQSGMAPKQCGSVIGRLVSLHGERVVADAVRAGMAAQPVAPVAYLVDACRRSAGGRGAYGGLGGQREHGASARQDALEARNRAVADKLAREFA